MSIGVPYSDPVIWVNGVGHPGTQYTIVTSTTQDPKEYLYWATVTLNYMGQRIYRDSRTHGPRRPGDLISIGCGQVNAVEFTNDFPLYQRYWRSADGTLNGRNVPRPQVVPGSSSYPAAYYRSSPMTLKVSTNGTGQNNGVDVQYQVRTLLANGPDTVWDVWHGWTGFAPGTPYYITTPALPGYVYKHSLQHTYYTAVVFAYDPPIGDRERRVVWAYDTISTPVFGIFSDQSHPLYRLHDLPNLPLQGLPWYELIDNALTHITESGNVKTVTTELDAMVRLTRDLHVYSNRPKGPADQSYYDPAEPVRYAYNVHNFPPPHQYVRFDLYGMMLTTRGDCQDFAAYLECQARAVGIAGVSKAHLGTPYGGSFGYHPVKRCGESWFGSGVFMFHRMAYYAAGGGIFDFAIGFQSGGQPDWTLALGWSQSQEYSALVASGSPAWSAWIMLDCLDPF